MPAPILIGDEISAAAYRLAGVRVRIPADDDPVSLLHWARAEAELVLITAQFAATLPEPVLRQAQAALHPLLLVVPDVRGHTPVPDLADQLRRQLGVEG